MMAKPKKASSSVDIMVSFILGHLEDSLAMDEGLFNLLVERQARELKTNCVH